MEERDASAAVLLVSAELDESLRLGDRIAARYKGRMIGTVPAKESTREQLVLLTVGIMGEIVSAGDSGQAENKRKIL